jgi:RHS repeat-associated protein
LNPPSSQFGPVSPFEEIRYDALGRRIWRRTQLSTAAQQNYAPTMMSVSTIERFVWDGHQLLAETRYPGSDSADAVPFWEADTGQAGARQFGHLDYVNGPALDRPLAVERFDDYACVGPAGSCTNTVVAPLAMAIHYNGRNLPDLPSFSNGAEYYCPSNGSPDASYGDPPCVDPGVQDDPVIEGAERTSLPLGWMGSVLIQQANATGAEYKLNRYYDPLTGQFTQEDPAGLGGGLNAYGFASGDPVNYDDPTGLDAWDYRVVLDPDFVDPSDGCPHCTPPQPPSSRTAQPGTAAGSQEVFKQLSAKFQPLKPILAIGPHGGVSATVGHYSVSGDISGTGELSAGHSLVLGLPQLGASVDVGLGTEAPAGAKTGSLDWGVGSHLGASLNGYYTHNGGFTLSGFTLHFGVAAAFPDAPSLTVDLH